MGDASSAVPPLAPVLSSVVRLLAGDTHASETLVYVVGGLVCTPWLAAQEAHELEEALQTLVELYAPPQREQRVPRARAGYAAYAGGAGADGGAGAGDGRPNAFSAPATSGVGPQPHARAASVQHLYDASRAGAGGGPAREYAHTGGAGGALPGVRTREYGNAAAASAPRSVQVKALFHVSANRRLLADLRACAVRFAREPSDGSPAAVGNGRDGRSPSPLRASYAARVAGAARQPQSHAQTQHALALALAAADVTPLISLSACTRRLAPRQDGAAHALPRAVPAAAYVRTTAGGRSPSPAFAGYGSSPPPQPSPPYATSAALGGQQQQQQQFALPHGAAAVAAAVAAFGTPAADLPIDVAFGLGRVHVHALVAEARDALRRLCHDNLAHVHQLYASAWADSCAHQFLVESILPDVGVAARALRVELGTSAGVRPKVVVLGFGHGALVAARIAALYRDMQLEWAESGTAGLAPAATSTLNGSKATGETPWWELPPRGPGGQPGAIDVPLLAFAVRAPLPVPALALPTTPLARLMSVAGQRTHEPLPAVLTVPPGDARVLQRTDDYHAFSAALHDACRHMHEQWCVLQWARDVVREIV